MRSILDTSVLLDPVSGAIDGELAISAATLAELHFGVPVARTDAIRAVRLRRVGEIERTFEALPLDAGVARQYSRLAAAVVAAGRQPSTRVMDLLIAATAVAHDARLITHNASDLAGLETLVQIVAVADLLTLLRHPTSPAAAPKSTVRTGNPVENGAVVGGRDGSDHRRTKVGRVGTSPTVR
jgi:toxin FitB